MYSFHHFSVTDIYAGRLTRSDECTASVDMEYKEFTL